MAFKNKETGEVVEAIRRKEWPEPADFKELAKMCGDRFAFDMTGMFIVNFHDNPETGEREIVSSHEIKPEDWVTKDEHEKIKVMKPWDFEEQFEVIQ